MIAYKTTMCPNKANVINNMSLYGPEKGSKSKPCSQLYIIKGPDITKYKTIQTKRQSI